MASLWPFLQLQSPHASIDTPKKELQILDGATFNYLGFGLFFIIFFPYFLQLYPSSNFSISDFVLNATLVRILLLLPVTEPFALLPFLHTSRGTHTRTVRMNHDTEEQKLRSPRYLLVIEGLVLVDIIVICLSNLMLKRRQHDIFFLLISKKKQIVVDLRYHVTRLIVDPQREVGKQSREINLD